MQYTKLVEKYKNNALDMLCELIKYKSVLDEYNPNSDAPFGIENKRCLDRFLEIAKEDGFKVYNDMGYAGHVEYGNGDKILGILAHLDVVPAVGEWQSDPFKASIRDGRIYARGSIDDKGPLVAAYIALKALKDEGVVPNVKIRLIVGCDEESATRCLNHYFKSQPLPDFGFSPDADFPLIYGEKAMNFFSIEGECKEIKSWVSGERANIVSDMTEVELYDDYTLEFDVFLKKNHYKGEYKNGKYVVYGKAAHGSMPRGGVNSNFIMSDFINTIMECKFTKMMSALFTWDYDGTKLGIARKCKDMGEVSINPGVIRIIDGQAKVDVDCRIPTNENYVEGVASKRLAEFGFKYVGGKVIPMHYVDPTSKLVKTLYKAYTDVTGDFKNRPFTIGGGTYAKLAPACVAFGALFPGREDVMHNANEYFELEDFYKTIAIYMNAIYELVK